MRRWQWPGTLACSVGGEHQPASQGMASILASIPLQLLAHHIAVLRGANVDQPRNLATSVTVE